MGMSRVFPLVPSASPSLEKRWGQARGAHALRLRSLRSARTVLLLLLFAPALAVAQSHNDKRATAASVDAPLRVCADPNDLPYSNHAGLGFENKLAEMLGQSLGKQVRFVWHIQGSKFLSSLYKGECDIVMGLPTADHAYGALTTEPYYRSAYVLVYRADAPYRLKSLDDPHLHTLRIGVHSVGADDAYLPTGIALARRGIAKNVRNFNFFEGYYRHANPSANLINAVADGDIDVALAWGPLAGYFATREPVKLTVVPLTHTHTVLPFQFSISMAVGHGNAALRNKLNAFLASHRAAIHSLLADYGVPQLDLNAGSPAPDTITQRGNRKQQGTGFPPARE